MIGQAGPQTGQAADDQGIRREQPVQRDAADLALWRVEAGAGGALLLCPERGPGYGMERCPGHGCGGKAARPGTKVDQGVTTLSPRVPGIFTDRPVYGPPMKLWPMTCAPTNEMGVVFLFGHLAQSLGLSIVRLQTAFPDAEALREMAPGDWQVGRLHQLNLKAKSACICMKREIAI